VLALQRAGDAAGVSISIEGQDLESLLAREWLLTNGRGGYASSTAAGCNTRGYHGLLIGSLTPPVNRIMALSACLEMVLCGQEAFTLSTFEFANELAPGSAGSLKRFRRDIGAHFDYELGKIGLTKSVFLVRDVDMVAIVYDFTRVPEPVELITRPFVGLRDFHSRQKSGAPLRSSRLASAGDGVLVRYDPPGNCSLLLRCPSAHFEEDPQWWFNFTYRAERERGLNFTEDLWAPGFFKCRIDTPTKVVLWASLHPYEPGKESAEFGHIDIDTVCRDLHKHQQDLLAQVKKGGTGWAGNLPTLSGPHDFRWRLYLAADQFVARRQIKHRWETTILAGYPWFADWGRDALISLPGLLLMTGRFEEARSVLSTFAAAADQGMIPNRFDDGGGAAHFNSVDASLWFINAAFEYLQATGDSKTFTQELLPTICWIIDSYRRGTRFGIHADADGLITAGDENTQLTWMDAKCDGIAFTPRHGKAVEVNALWYNALMLMKNLVDSAGAEADAALAMADGVKKAFCRLFWNEDKGYLNDCILPDGTADQRLRPNQIFAVSLNFSPLSAQQQAAVVKVVQQRLLTPYGLRTLPADVPGYKGRYAGPPRQRDEAYHQGTVWPYLMGPFVEAYLKVHQFSPESRKQAAEFIGPLLRHLTEDGCIGSISEIFDADPPHKPRGCIAQAWSVAELIRAYHLINSPSVRRERRGPH
jgi:predicted glycogen debranching enzyme